MESSFSSTSIAPPSGVAQPLRRPVSVVNNGTIGHPHTFTIGLLSPRTIRVRLEEIQKPDLGRKYARKDKRPLDPPPVVLCRFYNITKGRDGKFIEIEMDPEQPAMGAICHLDLFPVPPQYYEAEEHLQRPTQVTMHDPVQHAMQGMRSPTHIPTPASIAAPQHDTASANTMFQLPSIPSHAVTSSVSPTLLGSALSTYPGDVHVAHVPSDPAAPAGWQEGRPSNSISSAGEPEKRDIVAWYGDVPIHESSKCSAMLSGGTSMQAEVIDYKGKKSAVFVFPDVAVKAEGLFFLRYRAFNVLSKCAAPTPMPVLAECYGGPFKIYSSKEFPGLQASTELTKNLALHGLRVNSRENPRRRRRPSTVMDDQDEDDDDDNPLPLPGDRTQRRTIGIRPSSRGAGSSTSPTSFASPSPSASAGGTSSFAAGPPSVGSSSRPLSGSSASSAASGRDTPRQWPQHP